MDYEHIIANGIYYLSASDNIQNNVLEFRQLLSEDNYYGEYGRAGEEVDLLEDLGEIETPTGRIIVWNNLDLQHKVGRLTVVTSDNEVKERKKKGREKKGKPDAMEVSTSPQPDLPSGIRKILCFFLVNPDRRIVSTKIVPEQQSVISLESAMEHRQNLMNDRKYKASRDAEDWESRTYTFCEH
jgi:hypothetical protein